MIAGLVKAYLISFYRQVGPPPRLYQPLRVAAPYLEPHCRGRRDLTPANLSSSLAVTLRHQRGSRHGLLAQGRRRYEPPDGSTSLALSRRATQIHPSPPAKICRPPLHPTTLVLFPRWLLREISIASCGSVLCLIILRA